MARKRVMPPLHHKFKPSYRRQEFIGINLILIERAIRDCSWNSKLVKIDRVKSYRNRPNMTAKIATLPAPFFSKYDSLASSPSTTRLTAGAIPESPSTHYSNYGFIDTLALAQRLRVHFLPITWQAALGPLNRGGQAAIYQALVNAQTSLAFKCFRTRPQTYEPDFQELINEIIVLTHPSIRQHPHIARLEGICWDIPQDAPISPVLVFEKAQIGDLYNFVTSTKGEDLSAEDRLNTCVDIGTAVRDMHSNGRYTNHFVYRPRAHLR